MRFELINTFQDESTNKSVWKNIEISKKERNPSSLDLKLIEKKAEEMPVAYPVPV